MTIKTEEDLINFLNSFEYGFELDKDGYYNAVIKANTTLIIYQKTLFGKKIKEEKPHVVTYNKFGTFVDLIRDNLEYKEISYDIPSCIVISKRLISADCNKFAEVIIHLEEKDESDKYDGWSYEQYDDVWSRHMHQYSKYHSPDELKDFIVSIFNDWMEKNGQRVKNINLYKHEGSIFKKCK